jgi:sulfonate transport system substrate-binding protein
LLTNKIVFVNNAARQCRHRHRPGPSPSAGPAEVRDPVGSDHRRNRMAPAVRPPSPPRPRDLARRTFLQGALGTAALLGLGACAKGDASGSSSSAAPSGAIPTSVPPGTTLTIASYQSQYQIALELSGLQDDLAFEVPDWPSLAAGPDVINAFRADSLELATNAGIPPIQAHYQGFDARIVAVEYHRKPLYVFSTAPGSEIETVDDFAGRKLAFSQGQAQGVVVLRALEEAGIDQSDVELVPLTSTQFLTALQSGQVDVAPMPLTSAFQYLSEYERDGARKIETDVVDLLSILWAPTPVLEDDAKAAAIASFIPLWARAAVWVHENPQPWIERYYVDSQNLPADEAAQVVEFSSKPEFPPTWDDAVAWEQETIELLADGGYVDPFDAEVLFDRRFESLAAEVVGQPYKDTDVEYYES